jgi:serine protease AprX
LRAASTPLDPALRNHSAIPAADHAKLSPEIDALDPNSKVAVIIQYQNAPTPDTDQAMLDRGADSASSLQTLNAQLVSINAGSLHDLARDPNVVYISPDRALSSSLNNATAAVNAPAAWNAGWTGTGVGVAVIDSGVDPSSGADLSGPTSLSGRVVYSTSFVPGNLSVLDAYGHGTHVAGIVAGSGASSQASNTSNPVYKGVAPNASIVNLRALDQNGSGSDSTVIAAIESAILNKLLFNIRVINLSLGRPVYESYKLDPLCQEVEKAWKSGIVVVVAAGNNGRSNVGGINGYGTITAPGNDPYVITVGAMKSMGTPQRTDDLIASYSSKGPTAIDHLVKPDIVAPGNLITSLLNNGSLLSEYPSNSIGTTKCSAGNFLGVVVGTAGTLLAPAPGSSSSGHCYFSLSGTSMAAAVVSGAVADLLQAQPTLTPDQVKARLMKTAYKSFPASSTAADPVTGATYTSYYDAFTVGAGYLDIAAALADKSIAAAPALSPAAVYNSSSNTVSMVGATGTVWGTSTDYSYATVWGTGTVWGTATVWGTGGVNGSATVWGTSSDQGFATVWGTGGTAASSTDAAEAAKIAIYGEK